MLADYAEIFERALTSLRLADVLDVIVVAVFLYGMISWLRHSASRGVITAICIFVVLYAAARVLQMYMTELLLRSLLAVVVVGAIVVFAADIRRFVDRIGTWRLFGGRARPLETDPVIAVITEAAFRMAEQKTGALIAIRGREPWERCIDGGVEMDGRPSLPLVYSLFNPTSPGHDGAMLIEGDRITRFGAHLPLSTNLAAVGRRGTRHTAAIGLSEQCDALVVVVSEERGTVMIAEGGALKPVESATELKSALSAFSRQHQPQRSTSAVDWWRKPSVQTAALALGVAVAAWFLQVKGSPTVARTLVAPLEFRNLQSQWFIDPSTPTEVRLTLRGPEQAFRLMDPGTVVVSLDMSRLKPGDNQFNIAADNIALPRALTLTQAEPTKVDVHATKLAPIHARVRVKTTGKLPSGLELIEAAPKPDRVELLSPADNSPADHVWTEPVDLAGITSSTVVKTRLVLPKNTRLADGKNPEVSVRIQVRPRTP